MMNLVLVEENIFEEYHVQEWDQQQWNHSENLNYSFVKTDFKFQNIKRQAALATITKVVMLAGKW